VSSVFREVTGTEPTARKLQLHLKLAEGRELGELAAALLARASFAGAVDGATFRVAVFDDDALQAAGGAVPPPAFASLDAYLELGLPVGSPDTALTDAARELRDELAPLIDSDLSVAVIGDEGVIREGNGEFHLFRAIRRWPGLSPDQFAYHLMHVHTLYGRLSPGRPGYRQLLIDYEASDAVAALVGVGISDIDAVAQILQTRELTFDRPPQQAGLIEATLTDGALIADRPRCFGGTPAHVIASNPPISG
jgi:hypothetical protein